MQSEPRIHDARPDELIQSFIYGRFEDIFLSQSRRAQVGMLLAATVIAGIWFSRTGAWAAVLWEAVAIAVTGWRMRYTNEFVRSAPAGGSMRRIAGLLAVNGVLMALPLLAFQHFDAIDRAAISIILLSSATASTVTTSGHRSLFLAFAGPMLVPLAVAWMLSASSAGGSPGEWGLAGLIIVFLLFLVSLGRQVNLVFEESSRYRYAEQQRNAELTVALAVAAESSRAKTQFLATASHDVRQPLHAMTLWIGAIRESKIAPETRNFLNKLESLNQSASEQLASLLDISKLDAGIVVPKLAPLCLDALLIGHHEAMQAVAVERGIRLDLQCSESLTVITDETLFTRILQNLTDNALKFTRRGGRVCLSLQREGGNALLSVSDSGIGIAAAEQERVFLEFYQVANQERDRAKGMGLGLSLVRRLCTMLDVKLLLASKLGAGTTISLRLPLSNAEVKPTIAAEDIDMRGLSVLVVDDDADVRESTEALLSQLGCKVHLAATGAEALEIAAGAAIDVILSDLRLRDGESGIDVIQQLHKLCPTARATIITGDTAPDRLREAEAAGMTPMIKPVARDKLLEVFRTTAT